MASISCPNCGQSVIADKTYSHMAVCSSCRSVLVFGEDAAKVRGKLAVLPPARSELYVGATGKVRGDAFTVLGRARYSCKASVWDEWYLQLSDNSSRWLVESEGRLTYEASIPNPGAEYLSLQLGTEINLGAITFRVREQDIARCEGGEGQLPFLLVQGEKTPFVDLESSDNQRASIEFGQGGTRTFLGREIPNDQLVLDAKASEIGIEDDLPLAKKTEAGKQIVTSLAGPIRSLNCHSCGGAMEVDTRDGIPERVKCPYCGQTEQLQHKSWDCPACGQTMMAASGDQAVMDTCTSCGAVADLRGELPEVLRLLSETPEQTPQIPIGTQFDWDSVRYTVVGWIRNGNYRNWIPDEPPDYTWDEYLLFNPDRGYLWLEISDGHLTLGRRISDGPTGDPEELTAPAWVEYRQRRFKRIEGGMGQILWVEGELPWIAQVGDTFSYADLVSVPYRLGAEWTRNEAEWFLGEYLERKDFYNAISRANDKDARRKIHLESDDGNPNPKHRPFPRSAAQSFWLLALTALVAFLTAISLEPSYTPPVQIGNFDAITLKKHAVGGIETPPFEVAHAGSHHLSLRVSNINNGWMYVAGEIIDAKGQVETHFSAQMMKFYIKKRGAKKPINKSRTYSDPIVSLKSTGPYKIRIRAKFERVYHDHGELPFLPKLELSTSSARDDFSDTGLLFLLMLGCIVWAVSIAKRYLGFYAEED